MGDESSSSESFDSDISISEEPIPGSPTTTTTTTSTHPFANINNNNNNNEDDLATQDAHTKQGYIEIKGGSKKNKIINKWRLSWCLLDRGSLFIYKNYEVCES